jgi:hypothetical protein
MKARLFFIFSVLLLLAAKPALADKSDTVRGKFKPITYSFTESMFAPGNIWAQNGWQNMRITDTTLNNFQIYTTHYNLGNTGLPYVPVLFSADLQPMGFFYGQDYVSNNFYADSSVRYFNTRAPYTQFYYVSDPQIHQFFQFTHAQNFGKNLDVSLGFKRIRSEGNYLNQSTNMNQLTLDAYYHTKRYQLFANILYDVDKFQQNGGLANDTDLASQYFTDRSAAPVNLNYASTEMFEQSFHVQQYYYLGYKNNDSLKNNPLFYISHSMRIAGHSNVFTDNNSADTNLTKRPYYELFAPITYDSLRYNEFSNDLSVGSGKGWNNIMKWEAGVKDQWIHFRNFIGINPQDADGILTLTTQKYTDEVFTNVISHARIYNAFDSGKVLFDASGQYIFYGSQQGDVQGVIQAGIKLDTSRFIKLSATYSNQAPPFIYQLYEGNNIDWYNQFANTITSNLMFTYYDRKWKLGITLQATKITNMVYFDSGNAQAAQYHPSVMVYCAGISKDFKLYKFHWATSEKLQYVADSVPLRLPRIVTENSIFFESYVFHHALLLRLGADFFYNTAYYGYAYMPVTDQYYIENSTKLGNYLYIDPFVSFRIKTFRMFVKFENVTEGLVPYNYYYALHYPMPDRTIRFGISWDFWN